MTNPRDMAGYATGEQSGVLHLTGNPYQATYGPEGSTEPLGEVVALDVSCDWTRYVEVFAQAAIGLAALTVAVFLLIAMVTA